MHMTRGTFRVLKRSGRVALIETANPAWGVGYSVRIGSLGLWSGSDLDEAQQQFDAQANPKLDHGSVADTLGVRIADP